MPPPVAAPNLDPKPQALHEPVNLFSNVVRDCRIVRISSEDAKSFSDSWADLESLIFPCENQYPKIDRWLREKVRCGVQSGNRNVFLGYHLGRPSVAAVVKTGESAKFCHLSVCPRLQDYNMGELFFALMAMSVRNESKTLKFTLPEGLWDRERSFFESFAFSEAKPIGRQYRLFERELYCEAPFSLVWPNVLRKLAKLRDAVSIDGTTWGQNLVLSVRPEYADKILEGKKTVEIRRSFSPGRVPASCLLYSTSPVQAVVGTVDIVRAVNVTKNEAWARFGERINCTEEQRTQYALGAKSVWALELANPRRNRIPVSLPTLRLCSPTPLYPPQSYSIVSDGSGWAGAMPVIAMLQTAFAGST